MYSSIVSSILMILFISSISILFSIPNIIATTTSSSLIEEACSVTITGFDKELCIQVLHSQPKVASATNLFDLSIAIMESGISNATNTRTYMISTLNKPNLEPNLKSTLQQCKDSYDALIMSFNSALSEVKNIKEYQTASYDLLIASTDDLNPCMRVVSSKGIKDGIVLSGNKAVTIYGLSAYEVVEDLQR